MLESSTEVHDRERFYELIARLRAAQGSVTLEDCDGRMPWPHRGVYFFFERGEFRPASRTDRIVRIGTHAVSGQSKTRFWTRLRQHRGSSDGGGNHCGSIFRLHIGSSLINQKSQFRPQLATWCSGKTRDIALRPIELEVSQHIRRMPFVWVAADDSPGPNSVRAYIERNAIGLLSRISPLGLTADPPSSNWLGSRCQNQTVRESGLWNVKHTECRYDRSFLTCLEKYVDETVAGGPGLCKSRTIALVGCVKSKRDHAAETRSLYTSALFIKAAAYAQRAADDWYILSAKHGLLSPHQIIAPYEQTLKGASSRDRSVWAGRVYEQMRAAGLLASRTRFLWLAGKMYQYPLITYLEDHEHIDPLKGLGIGARLQWLTANSRK